MVRDSVRCAVSVCAPGRKFMKRDKLGCSLSLSLSRSLSTWHEWLMKRDRLPMRVESMSSSEDSWCVCVRARVSVRACVRACVRECVREGAPV